MKRRSKLEIYLDILKAVSETSKLTHIGNMANLSWKDAVRHLSFVRRRGFVEVVKTENGREEYRLTQKGLEALETLQKITNALTPKKTAIAV